VSSFCRARSGHHPGVVVLTTRCSLCRTPPGVSIPQPTAPPLKVGDEVEVTGEVHPETSVPPWSTPRFRCYGAHAGAAGFGDGVAGFHSRYAATFVEVQGRLVGKERGPDNTLILDLDEGPQSFRAT